MKLDIYKIMNIVTEFDYDNRGLKISLEKGDYISKNTFVNNIKETINIIGTSPDRIHYNDGKIDIYYSGYSNIGFD